MTTSARKWPIPTAGSRTTTARRRKAWVKAQNKVTFGFLEAIPQRDAIRERLEKLWNYERFGIPFKRGDRWFFTRNSGLQNQSVLYTANAPDGEAA